MARSLTELRQIAEDNGINTNGMIRSRDVMDALRNALGTVDPDLQIDPMKAKDLKNKIDWTKDGVERFRGIPQLNQDHVIEPKLDGARVRIFLGATGNTINSGQRSVKTYAYIERADNFPHIRDAVVPDLTGTILDAEILMPGNVFLDDKRGWTQGPLNSIMAVFNIDPEKGIARQEKHGWAIIHVFDVLAHNGESTMDLEYTARRDIAATVVHELNQVAPQRDTIRLVDAFPAKPEVVQNLIDAGFEGGMVKLKSGTYRPGKRGNEWLKIKKMSTGDFFIVGSNPGNGRNEGKVGSLKVAYMGEDGPVECADVRGFDDATCDELTNAETGEVKDRFLGQVLEIMAQGRTKNDRLRHPHFVRWREDKTMDQCDRTQLELFDVV